MRELRHTVADPAKEPSLPPNESRTDAASPSLFTLLLRSVRPRQWTKNLAVFAPLVFAKSVLDEGAVLRASLAVVSFCLLAGGVYVFNDLVDRDRDRLHPEKRNRPIASGLLSSRAAITLLLFCWLSGSAIAYWVRPEFAAIALGYVVLQILYSFVFKRWVIVDVVIIALGFVIRVVGGGVAISVPVSNWLYLCTLLLAVFLGFAKRRHEISSLPAQALPHRENLNEYSLSLLDQMLSVVAASCILAYGLYTVAQDTIDHVGSDRLKFTVPFVIYGIFRYLFLIHRRGAGGSPERVLLSDPPMVINLLLYLAVVGWALYF
jgi:4-hydroxybenzoate polyprenyltransferase